MLAAIGGFAIRYLPDMFGWVGNWIKGKQEDKREESAMRLQLQIEQAKAAGAAQTAGINAESAEVLAGLQGEMDEIKQAVSDRADARKFGSKALERLNETLALGVKMGLPRFVLGIGWYMVLGIECLSASVQPLIAGCVFAMWMYIKIKSGIFSADISFDNLPSLWGPEDWDLMWAVIGFYLAGRVKKHQGKE